MFRSRDVIFKHHLAGHAPVKIETLTDGHLLHVAVWPLLNDILRVAAERGVTVHQLEVSGGLAGISYSCGSAAKREEELRRLIRDCEQDSPNSPKPAAVFPRSANLAVRPVRS